MIRLDNNKYITIKTDAAATSEEPQYISAYDDIDSIGITITPGGEDGLLNGMTLVIAVSSPIGILYRNVKYLSVFNSDTVTRIITVSLTDGIFSRTMIEVSLDTNETLIYNDGAGWIVMSTQGQKGLGTSGYSGSSGFSGVIGFSGFSGISGFSGLDGIGTSGFSGFSGTSGQDGFIGSSGVSGFSGVIGTSGFSGYSGVSGLGLSGFSGQGISGFSGFDGATGTSGFSGFDGESGVSGFSGIDAIGESGFSGKSGFSGLGLSGFSGFSGTIGSTGTSGFSGVSGFSGNNGDKYSTTSITSFAIPILLDSVTFTVDTGLSWTVNQDCVVSSVASPSNYFDGTVTAYNSVTGDMTVQAKYIIGSGTFDDWTINLDGAVGVSGFSGQDGSTGSTGASGFSGYTGVSGFSGYTGVSGFSGIGTSGFSGSSAAAGYALTMTPTSKFSPADATTYYFGVPGGFNSAGTAAIADITTGAQAFRMYIPKTGTLTACVIWTKTYSANSSGENTSFYVLLNNTTAVTVTTTFNAWAGFTSVSNTALSQAVTAGDYVEMKVICPTWATNPTQCQVTATIYIATS